MNWDEITRQMSGATCRPAWFAAAAVDLALRGKFRLLREQFGVEHELTDPLELGSLLRAMFVREVA